MKAVAARVSRAAPDDEARPGGRRAFGARSGSAVSLARLSAIWRSTSFWISRRGGPWRGAQQIPADRPEELRWLMTTAATYQYA
jgi:hypothetical protein